MDLQNLKELFLEDLEDQFDAQNQVLDAFPGIIKMVSSPSLRHFYDSVCNGLFGHLDRMGNVFLDLHEQSGGKMCQAMEAMIMEIESVPDNDTCEKSRDMALMSTTSRILYYLFAGYGVLLTRANQINNQEHSALFESCREDVWKWIQTLEENNRQVPVLQGRVATAKT